jgi:hypothetical protein
VAGPGSEDPRARVAEADESTLPRRAIEGAAGRSAGRLRFCYQDGLRREPGLAGRIPVRFVVDPGGTVVVASDAGSTVADPAVVRCVLSAFAAMVFPPRAYGDAVWATYVVAFPPE